MDEAEAGIPHAKESVLYLLLMCPIVNGHRLRHHSAQTVKGGGFDRARGFDEKRFGIDPWHLP